MASVKVKWNRAGYWELLNSAEVLRKLQEEAETVAEIANAEMPESDYRMPHHLTTVGRTRHDVQEVSVYTATDLARAMQAKHDTLTKALRAAGG